MLILKRSLLLLNVIIFKDGHFAWSRPPEYPTLAFLFSPDSGILLNVTESGAPYTFSDSGTLLDLASRRLPEVEAVEL
ncbi:unnamed protein product [Tilletia laevis]|uniref:Uncharacterized protein n=1 Tax=Tilletia caries TaxID=13290 RepID=A0A177VDR1_9BASI|nr:hypothetical protein A4X03_0g9045 [Tilletia caries]CAD6917417.1 unnamed protein product [Tilletia controversa]CAD6917658.1 unnamed protein product [Tilletia laevis]CAD6884525.1 unnamed protein product [Tilletia caries]CAD6954110.1 unnamed protein product [Tilletia controversa]